MINYEENIRRGNEIMRAIDDGHLGLLKSRVKLLQHGYIGFHKVNSQSKYYRVGAAMFFVASLVFTIFSISQLLEARAYLLDNAKQFGELNGITEMSRNDVGTYFNLTVGGLAGCFLTAFSIQFRAAFGDSTMNIYP
ncbi:MAG: hypothetical protein IPK68_04065 [Bdellovibrionales bacterium]|nr:hypothetical protein [Bdellovibrionales bacterium]